MNCIIIEDEGKAIKRLKTQLEQTGYQVEILACIDSVEASVPWLQSNRADLIFLDVQLGDGLGFEIFDHVQVTTPVIFTTSYDEYITRAFEVNSISYLLKPVMLDKLKKALDKFHLLNQVQPVNNQIISLHQQHQQRFLVKQGRFFQSLNINDIAYFYVQNKRFLFIITHDKQQYLYDSTLEILETRLDSSRFFRINRQCIVSYDCVKMISIHDIKGRLKLDTVPASKEEMIVSSYRAVDFKHWLDR